MPRGIAAFVFVLALSVLTGGCVARRAQTVADSSSVPEAAQTSVLTAKVASASPEEEHTVEPGITLVGHETTEAEESSEAEFSPIPELAPVPVPAVVREDSLLPLEQLALDQNPRLAKLYQEYQAAAARSQYADKLPDPKVGANVFGNPIETAAGSQQANLNVSQTIPWLGRLDAQQQQACLEALAIRAEYRAERLKVVAGIRTGWYRLYVLDRQIEITEANQQLLQSLIDIANARVSTGSATAGDVLLGTVEFSQLEEKLLTLQRQRTNVESQLNQLLGRPAGIPIASAREIVPGLPDLDAETVHQIALNWQPEIEAARLRTQATRWGVEVARLSRRPEMMFSASYFVTDDNRPPSTVVKVGEDPWALGVQVSIPLWKSDYDAMANEARWKHQAAHSSVADLSVQYDATIVDLLAEAERAAETATLYQTTILPQAQQALTANQDAYANGTVDFDRVIRDYRNLLTLELGYHQAIGDLAVANARLKQAAGQDLLFPPLPLNDRD